MHNKDKSANKCIYFMSCIIKPPLGAKKAAVIHYYSGFYFLVT